MRAVKHSPGAEGLPLAFSSLAARLRDLPPSQRALFFGRGLDVATWATSAISASPPLDYLDSTCVALVLSLVVQLSCYLYVWARGGKPPASASIGHSQGLAVAMVVALADDEQSFENHAFAFAHVLLEVGLAVAEVRLHPCKQVERSRLIGVLSAPEHRPALPVRQPP